jgi:hypothetical protein
MPINDEATIMCPVDDTGKNSVIPSIMARIITCMIFIGVDWGLAQVGELIGFMEFGRGD